MKAYRSILMIVAGLAVLALASATAAAAHYAHGSPRVPARAPAHLVHVECGEDGGVGPRVAPETAPPDARRLRSGPHRRDPDVRADDDYGVVVSQLTDVIV